MPAKPAAAGKRQIPQLKGVEPKLAQLILDEIMEGGAPVLWDDIAGQEVAILYPLKGWQASSKNQKAIPKNLSLASLLVVRQMIK